MGDNNQVLLETDKAGKVLTNNFDPNHKLAFYQQEKGEKTMLYDEADKILKNVYWQIGQYFSICLSKKELRVLTTLSGILALFLIYPFTFGIWAS